MNPLGKIVTAGIALVAGTSLLTGVTTAYMLRPAAPAESVAPTYATPSARRAPMVAAARVVPAVNRTTTNTPRPVPAATTASECAAGDRAWRIAKPGAVGGLLGAGLGAAGGAIADGGSGAGKGALIGGLIGAATGAGYGAYKTNNDCGPMFGNPGFTADDPGHSERAPASEAALRPPTSNDITVYSAR